MTSLRRVLTPELLEDRCTPTTFTVTTLADTGAGSLRQAVLDANNEAANPGSDTIVFGGAAVGGTINLLTLGGTQFGPNGLEISSTVVIQGTGETIARGGAAPAFRLFYVAAAGNLTLSKVTLSNGLARGGNGGTNLGDDGGGGGGGLGAGGAIYNQGTVSILNSTLSGNTARGGDGGAGADNAGTDAGGGGGGGGMGGNGGTTPDNGTDSGAGGGGFFGNGVGGAAAVGGGGGGTTNDAIGATGGIANGGAGGASAANGTPGGLGGGGGGGGDEGTGGAGGIGGGGGGGGEEDNGTTNGAGAGGFGGGGGGSGEDGVGGAGGFGAGGGGGSNDGATAQAGGTGGLFGGSGGSTLATGGSGGGGGGAGLGGAVFNDGGTLILTGSTLSANTATGGTGGAAGGTAAAGTNGQGTGGGVFNHLGTVTVVNGTVTANTVSTNGGGLFNAANMTVTDSVVSANTAAGAGGGIENAAGATLTVTNSTISGNAANGAVGGGAGGGIDNFGTATLSASTISGNTTAADRGAGLENRGAGAMSVRDCSVVGNVSADGGGGIRNVSTLTLDLTNTTIANNTAQAGTVGGGGISTAAGTVTIVNCTITGNSDATTATSRSGGVSHTGGTVTVANTVVANNTTADTVARDVRGTFAAGSVNNFFTFVDANTNLAGGVDGNLVAADAKLGPLQNNGGPTQTRLPLTGSPLINAGSNAAAVALTSDQRGFLPRTVGGTIDIGSVEVGAAVPAAPAITSAATTAFTPGVAGTFTVTSTGNPTATLTATGLPTGVTLTDNGDGTATLASTTTAAPGNYPLVITAANGVGTNATQNFTLTIRAPIPYFLGGPTDGSVRTLSNSGGTLTLGAAFAGIAGLGVNARTAIADVTGDGIPDFIVGAGPGAVSRVAVLNGTDKSVLVQFNVFETTFTGGVFVAAADIDGDGKAEVVVTPDESGGPVVAVYRGSKLAAGVGGDAAQLTRFFGIAGDPNFRGGCRPALGDVNGDGAADLVVSAGVQGGPRIAIFDGQALKAGSGDPGRLVGDFFAFEDTLRNGAFVAAGDVTGDGRADIAFGGGPGGAPRVRLFDGKALLAAPAFGNVDAIAGTAQRANFFAGDPTLRGGVRLALHDVDGNGAADLAAGSGAGEPSHVRFYRAATLLAGAAAADQDVDPFGAVLANGVFVG